MDLDTDEGRDIEYIRQFVESKFGTVGLETAFRRYDATDSNAGSIEILPNTIAERNKFGFDIGLIDDAETFQQGLHWKTEHLTNTISRWAYQSIDDAVTNTVSSVKAAEQEIDGGGEDGDPLNPVLVLPGRVDVTIGIPGATTVAFDPYSMDPEVGLYADGDVFGFDVEWTPVEVLEYRDEIEDRDVANVRFRRDYVVTNPDAGVWVDFSR